MQQPKIRIGTRGSKLALWQAQWVADRLKKAGFDISICTIETKGDKELKKPLSKIGTKGIFTQELEQALIDQKIDIAVHSTKDLPSTMPTGFHLIAFGEREKPHDVVISDKKISLSSPITLGTSSVRRVALLKHFYPQAQTVDIRGNLQTRIAKMKTSKMDGIVLAYAGIERMGYSHLIQSELSVEQFTPPVGQGAIAIESYATLDASVAQKIKSLINHPPTALVTEAERSFLKTIGGGCSIPTFAYCTVNEDDSLSMTGGIVSLDGAELIKFVASDHFPLNLGKLLAEKVLSNGGEEILKDILATRTD